MSVQSTEDRKSNKRRLFLEAARRIFAGKGYQAANVTDIVAAVKSGQGTFYYHFKDKQAIFDELMLGFLGKLARAVAENESRAGDRTALAYRPLAVDNARRIAAVFLDNIDLAGLFFRESKYIGGDAMARVGQFYDALFHQVETGIRDGREKGLVRPEVDPRVAAYCFVGAAERVIYETIRSGAPADLDSIAEQIVDFQSHGILVRAPGN